MGRDNSPEIHGVNKGIGAISGPLAPVVELLEVPHDLVHDLGQLDGVASRAGAASVGAEALAVGDVRLVVHAVEIDAVPAAVANLAPLYHAFSSPATLRPGVGRKGPVVKLTQGR